MHENDRQYPHTILVPVGRPDTARTMLKLASSFVDPEEGVVIALLVALGDTEKANNAAEEISPIVEQLREQGHRIELATEIATSVSRGILDAAREKNADLMILGVHKPDHRRVKLGTVVENVIQASPCNSLIYRHAHSPSFDRILVPVDGLAPTTAALSTGVQLAKRHEKPLSVLNIQTNYHYQPENEQKIQSLLAEVDPIALERKIIVGRYPANRMLKDIGENDLLILGFQQRSDFERQITDDLTNRLLNRSPGPVIMISRLDWHDSLRGRVQKWFFQQNPTLTNVEQNEMIWQAQKTSAPNLDYIIMILLSAALATLGLLINSAAVIIGAMLVAPLMQPLSGFATGLSTAVFTLTRRAMVTLIQGIILALLVSVFSGLLLPIDQPTSEMLARGNPSLLDAAVALVSGLVAAYASARKGIPAALAGVAIAAALMPPLCTIGLGLAFQNEELAFGAALLFFTNIGFIIMAQAVVFLWLGLRPGEREGTTPWTRLWWGGIIAMLVLVLTILFNLRLQAVDELAIQQRLQEFFTSATIVQMDVPSTDPLSVTVFLQSEEAITSRQVQEAQEMLAEDMERDVQIEVIRLPVVRVNARDMQIRRILSDMLAVEVLDIDTQGSDPMVIVATVRTERDITLDEVSEVQQGILELMEMPVELEIIFQRVQRFSVEITPESESVGND